MTTFERLRASKEENGAGLWVLLDPDCLDKEDLVQTTEACVENGADAILFGGSFLISTNFERMIREVKHVAPEIPLVIFPGDTNQISSAADAILFLSMVSGRNSELLIGQQAKAAPTIKAMGLEPIATGYLLVESGTQTTVEYVSNTKPLPRNKPDIAMAHALAAEYLGMSCVYLDAGSGAGAMVPVEMIKAVSDYISIPVIAGGGIRQPEDAAARAEAGASFVVVGSVLEGRVDKGLIREFSDAIHTNL
jgi:putative glycerol-1-phosphate prenyltransferase